MGVFKICIILYKFLIFICNILVLKNRKKQLLIRSNKLIKLLGIFQQDWLFTYPKEHILPLTLRLSMHKRIQYFIAFDKGTVNFYVYSAGRLLQPACKRFKFYKKVKENIGPLYMRLTGELGKRLSYIYILMCKNFNFRQYSWIKKYIKLAKPEINFFWITQSWAFSRKNKRRIKKSIFKLLLL